VFRAIRMSVAVTLCCTANGVLMWSRDNVSPGTDRQLKSNGKVVRYSIPELVSRALSEQSVSPQATEAINLAVGSMSGQRLHSQSRSISALWRVPNYTAWKQRNIAVSILSRGVTHAAIRCERESNRRPCKSDAVRVEPPTASSRAVLTTTIRPRFDRATIIRRPTLRP